MTTISLTMEDIFPVSYQHVHAYRAFGKGKLIKFRSKKANEFRKAVIEAWTNKHGDKIIFPNEKLVVTLTVYHPKPSKLDVDNHTKELHDSLTGLAWTDDSQIYYLMVTKEERKIKGFFITISDNIPLKA